MKKSIMTVILMSLITAMASAQKLYPYKSSKKNYKTMKRSTLLADANRGYGNPNKATKQLAKMQEKQEKQNKKSSLFK